MKKTSIYVDTSVIGGCCDSEFKEWSRGLLSDFQSRKFSLLLSELTDAEIQDAPDEVKNAYIEFRECTDSIFLISPKAVEMVRKIRDKQFEETKGLSVEEQIEFIRKKSEELQKRFKRSQRSIAGKV